MPRGKRPARNTQLLRALRIIRDLDRFDGADIYELAERHGTDDRTIRRDLRALEEAGLPLVESREGTRKRWRIAFRDALAQVSDLIDITHALALRLAMSPGGAVPSTSSAFAVLEHLAQLLDASLGEGERRDLRLLVGAFHSYEKLPYARAAPDVLWPLVTAIARRRVCRINYRPPRPDGAVTERSILPLKIFVHQQAVYVHAEDIARGSIITLNVQRFESLETLDDIREPSVPYDSQQLEDSAFGIFVGGPTVRYRIRFDREVAPYIRERIWHPSQELRELEDGGVEIAFTCNASFEVTAWVASWRQAAEVLEPDDLKQELLGIADYYQRLYGEHSRRG